MQAAQKLGAVKDLHYSWYLTEEKATDGSSVTCSYLVFKVFSFLKKWEILFESHS